MPRRKTFELPEDLAKAYPDSIRPKRVAVNRLAHTCPLLEYTGTILTPMSLSAPDYNDWWTKAGKGQPDDDDRHWSIFEWETRFHIVKQWDLQDLNKEVLDNEVIQADPLTLPDMRLVTWVIAVTQPIIAFSVSLPNLQGPLSDMSTP